MAVLFRHDHLQNHHSMATTTTHNMSVPVLFKPANRDFSKRWLPFGPAKQTLPKGWQKAEGRRALSEAMIFERDVSVRLRDGASIWMDVFRPVASEKEPVPAIVAWSPYGKQGNGACIARQSVSLARLPCVHVLTG
jgi:predicted acyl esterase